MQKEVNPNEITPFSTLQKYGLMGGSSNICSAADPALELVPMY
jgi:hypothetical protein